MKPKIKQAESDLDEAGKLVQDNAQVDQDACLGEARKAMDDAKEVLEELKAQKPEDLEALYTKIEDLDKAADTAGEKAANALKTAKSWTKEATPAEHKNSSEPHNTPQGATPQDDPSHGAPPQGHQPENNTQPTNEENGGKDTTQVTQDGEEEVAEDPEGEGNTTTPAGGPAQSTPSTGSPAQQAEPAQGGNMGKNNQETKPKQTETTPKQDTDKPEKSAAAEESWSEQHGKYKKSAETHWKDTTDDLGFCTELKHVGVLLDMDKTGAEKYLDALCSDLNGNMPQITDKYDYFVVFMALKLVQHPKDQPYLDKIVQTEGMPGNDKAISGLIGQIGMKQFAAKERHVECDYSTEWLKIRIAIMRRQKGKLSEEENKDHTGLIEKFLSIDPPCALLAKMRSFDTVHPSN